MWFKNLQIYGLDTAWGMGADALEAQLASHAFQPCGNMDMESLGWIPPFGKDRLVRNVAGHWLIRLCHEQKLLPSDAVNRLTQERASQIEEKEGYRPGRKQVREIKERVTDELLPRAFGRRRATLIWIDPYNGWLVVDAPNVASADLALELLRKSTEDLPARVVKPHIAPATAMRTWLNAKEAPAGFSIDRDCDLRSDLEDKSTVRYSNHPLDTDEVKNHLADGKAPTRLAMTWADRLSFVLTERMEVKNLEFLDVLKEQSGPAESEEEQFDADFAIMALELSRFLLALVDALGGEEEEVPA
ncbi:MAG: recombination-associated protein RdgC [Rhodocyclaceae bacterium]|nr:recombination-associated protein RdgC [Rhodocyclaceae bacterium]